MWTAGQVIGLIHDIPTCDELVKRIEKEAEETLIKATSLITSDKADSWPAPAPGKVEKHMNNPGAEIWGVGQSKL